MTLRSLPDLPKQGQAPNLDARRVSVELRAARDDEVGPSLNQPDRAVAQLDEVDGFKR